MTRCTATCVHSMCAPADWLLWLIWESPCRSDSLSRPQKKRPSSFPWRSDDSGYSVLWESDVFDTRQTLIAEQMALGSHTGPHVCVCQRLDCMAAKGKQSYPRLKVIQKRHNYSTIHPASHTIAYGPATLAQNMQL